VSILTSAYRPVLVSLEAGSFGLASSRLRPPFPVNGPPIWGVFACPLSARLVADTFVVVLFCSLSLLEGRVMKRLYPLTFQTAWRPRVPMRTFGLVEVAEWLPSGCLVIVDRAGGVWSVDSNYPSNEVWGVLMLCESMGAVSVG
jgi:hypothetical protein